MKFYLILILSFSISNIYCQIDSSDYFENQITSKGIELVNKLRTDTSNFKFVLCYYVACSFDKSDSILFNIKDTSIYKLVYASCKIYSGVDSVFVSNYVKELSNKNDISELMNKLIQSRVWMLNSTNHLKYRFKFIYIPISN